MKNLKKNTSKKCSSLVQASNILHDYYSLHLKKHGDTALGAAWPNDKDRNIRFKVCEDIINNKSSTQSVTVCDIGCGTGSFLDYLKSNNIYYINYAGVDILEESILLARKKFPNINFYNMDILQCEDKNLSLIDCDFIVINGLFTVKSHIDEELMWTFMTAMLEKVWPHARRGIIFNVMSKIVDWERNDLFHVSYDRLARYLHGLAGRHIGFRADYGLYEYMAYALKPADLGHGTQIPDPLSKTPKPHQEPADFVYRPLLPTLPHIAPYISIIDQTRRYTNHGTLSISLGRRLSKLFGLEPDEIWLTSSGTMGLLGAILASVGRARPNRPLALCPAYTFVATASTAEMAGYQPYFVDVDADTWAFEPAMAKNHPLLDKVGLVLVTAPYGQTFSQQGWVEFMQSTGIPVVIDAAGAFENISANFDAATGPIPVVLSLHATKTFGCGEGGAVLCRNPALFEHMTAALNFGFCGDRCSRISSTNGKMSEYHAAVGLAELDHWETKKTAYQNVVGMFRRIADILGVGNNIVTAPRIASCYILALARDSNEADRLKRVLDTERIPYRHWYGPGLPFETVYSSMPHDDLPNTERLGRCLIGLPMAPDFSRTDVERIVTAVADGLRESGS